MDVCLVFQTKFLRMTLAAWYKQCAVVMGCVEPVATTDIVEQQGLTW